MSKEEVATMDAEIIRQMEVAMKLAADDEISPILGFEKDEQYLDDMMYARGE